MNTLTEATDVSINNQEDLVADHNIKIDRKTFITQLKNCIKFVSKDPNRPVLDNIKIENIDGEIALVATDGMRMIVEYLGRWFHSIEFNGFLLSSYDATSILKLANKNKLDYIHLIFYNQFSILKVCDSELSQSLTIYSERAKYPNWKAVIPNENDMISWEINYTASIEIDWTIKESILMHDLYNVKYRIKKNKIDTCPLLSFSKNQHIGRYDNFKQFRLHALDPFINLDAMIEEYKLRDPFVVLNSNFVNDAFSSCYYQTSFYIKSYNNAIMIKNNSHGSIYPYNKIIIMPSRHQRESKSE